MISFVCRLQSADSRDTQRAIRHITALRADCYSTNEYSIFFFNRDANFYFTILRLISVCRRRRRRRSLCTYESEFSLSLDAIENGRTKIEQWSLRLSDAVITNLVIAVFSRHLKIVRILHVNVHVCVCVQAKASNSTGYRKCQIHFRFQQCNASDDDLLHVRSMQPYRPSSAHNWIQSRLNNNKAIRNLVLIKHSPQQILITPLNRLMSSRESAARHRLSIWCFNACQHISQSRWRQRANQHRRRHSFLLV